VKAGGGFVENEERGAGWIFFSSSTAKSFFPGRCGLGEVSNQFEALGFAAGELAEGLAAAEVTETDLGEKLEGGADLLVALLCTGREILG
jgi:hypothetical protein